MLGHHGIRRATLVAVAVIGLTGSSLGTPVSGAAAPSTGTSWEPVQRLDNRQVGVDGSVVTRAGTSVLLWSRGDAHAGEVYTSVRRADATRWSARTQLPGAYTQCAPGSTHPVKLCSQLVIAGQDDVVLFAARESEPHATEHVLSVRRLMGNGWDSLADVAVPAPVNQVQGAANDVGDLAVAWLDDDRTLGGAVSVQGGAWADLPPLSLSSATRTISYLQQRDDGGVVAVLHVLRPNGRTVYKVATLVDGSWLLDVLIPNERLGSPPIVGSSPAGGLVVGWAEEKRSGKQFLAVAVRGAEDAEFGPTEVLADDWPCAIVFNYCARFTVLDSGVVAGLWYINWFAPEVYGSTYDTDTDEWTARTRLAPGYVKAHFGVHPDGTAVLYTSYGHVWSCRAVIKCTYVESPDFFGGIDRDKWTGEFGAGPNGAVVGFASKIKCGETACIYPKLEVAMLPSTPAPGPP